MKFYIIVSDMVVTWVMGKVLSGSHGSWLTWVMGRVISGSHWSLFVSFDPLPAWRHKPSIADVGFVSERLVVRCGLDEAQRRETVDGCDPGGSRDVSGGVHQQLSALATMWLNQLPVGRQVVWARGTCHIVESQFCRHCRRHRLAVVESVLYCCFLDSRQHESEQTLYCCPYLSQNCCPMFKILSDGLGSLLLNASQFITDDRSANLLTLNSSETQFLLTWSDHITQNRQYVASFQLLQIIIQ